MTNYRGEFVVLSVVTVILIGVLFAFVGPTTVGSSAPQVPPSRFEIGIPHPPPPAEVPKGMDQLLTYWAMAGQNGRMVDQMHSTLMRWGIGWDDWVVEHLQPDLDMGFRRVMIHLPFGKDTTRDPRFMSFDSYLHAQERDLDLLWKGFSRAMRPLIRGKYTDGERVQVICYLGALKFDRDFVELLKHPHYRDNWLWRVWRSMQPVLDAGCEIAFDTGGTWKPDDPAYWIAGMVKALGAGGWMEGTEYGYVWGVPRSQQELTFHGHLKGFPMAANHQQYWDNIADVEHGGRRPVEGHHWAQISPGQKVILMVDGHSAPRNADGSRKSPREAFDTLPDWLPPMVRRDLAAGFSVALSARALRMHDLTPAEVLTRPEAP